jgi:site-specific recombinase XerD
MEWISLSGDLTRESAVERLLAPSTSVDADSELGMDAGPVRRVDAVAAAAVRLRMERHHREHEQGTVTLFLPNDLVFCNAYGRRLDDSAIRRRYRRAQAAAEVRPLRFHDLRHTFGSQLAARGVDLVSIKEAMGHAALSTTNRYLHARPASEQARLLTAAFSPQAPDGVAAAVNAR